VGGRGGGIGLVISRRWIVVGSEDWVYLSTVLIYSLIGIKYQYTYTYIILFFSIIVIMPEVYAAPLDYAFERNFKGYGEKGLPSLKWPNNAKIAVSFVINYEEVCRIHNITPSPDVPLTSFD